MDTFLYDLSIPAISKLQAVLSPQANLMQLLSVVFDPKYAFLLYSPIAYLSDNKVGKKLMMTTVIAEWLNQVLKWFLHGERPYWYVHSSGHFDPQQVPIKQFPITCELGPGHPSGHAMVTAAVWYIILDSALKAYTRAIESTATNQDINGGQQYNSIIKNNDDNNNNNNNNNNSISNNIHHINSDEKNNSLTIGGRLTKVKSSVWSFYALLLIVVSTSRVFLGCHFPHQCMAGACLGLLVAKYVSSMNTRAMHFILASPFLFVTAFGTYGLLQVLGMDPSWTIQLATTHCVKREYIHIDTAPFFSIMRYCGFALGCGIGLLYPLRPYSKQLVPTTTNSDLNKSVDSSITTTATTATVLTSTTGNHVNGLTKSSNEKSKLVVNGRQSAVLISSDKEKSSDNRLSSRNLSWFSAKLLMALMMARLVDNLGLFVSHSNLPLFYSSAFFAYTLFSFSVISLSQ